MNTLLTLFGIGFAAGLALAIPVGPMAIMLINTTIERGWRHGVLGALAMATVDYSYAVTVFYIGQLVAGWLSDYGLALSLGGAAILLVLGAMTLVRNLRRFGGDEKPVATTGSRKKTFATFLGATVLNPPTALYFLALAPSLTKLGEGAGWATGLVFAVGVFVGSVIWQESLALAGVGLRAITHGRLRAIIGALGGVLIIALSITMAAKALA